MRFDVVAIVLFGLCASSVVERVSSAKILAIVATPSYSNQIPFRPLWIELSRRGHEVLLVTANPIPGMNTTNFRQIDVSSSYKTLRSFDFVKLRLDGHKWLSITEDQLLDICDTLTENVFNNTQIREIFAPGSNEKFDVVLTEFLYLPALYAFAYRFDAPLIGLSSMGLASINEYVLGSFVLPSHESTWETEANTGPNVSFWGRLWNFVTAWRFIYIFHRDFVPRQQKIAEHYLGMRLPPLLDIQRNASLLFLNQADILTPARPKLANMITFSSFHVEKNPAPLPKDLEDFINGSKDGFIYFSLGSNARSTDLPPEIKQILFDVFAKLPYRVVWKYEEDLKEKPANVYTGKWLPQQSILVHPKIKLFIYQAGMRSTEEAVGFAVPVLALPIMADQDYQAGRMEDLGIGKRLEIRTLTRDELDHAIRELITNKEYKERMYRIRNIIQDTPYNMVEHLAWWTEFVIRHKGADHLRSTLAWQPWYQRNDLDVVIFITIVLFVIASTSVSLVSMLAMQLHRRLISPAGHKQKIS